MNVMFCWPVYFNPIEGGVERVTDVLARELSKRGHKIYFCHLRPFGEVPKYNYPVEIIICPDSNANSDANHEFYRTFIRTHKIDVVINQAGAFEDAFLFGDVGIADTICFHVVHNNPQSHLKYLFNFNCQSRQPCWIERLKRLARIVIYPKIKYDFKIGLTGHYQRVLNSSSRHIVLLSPRYVSSLKQIVPSYPTEQISAIGNPCPFAIEQCEKEKILLWVGRMEMMYKRPDRMIKVWKKIHTRFPDWKLVMVGDGSWRKTLEKKSKNLPRVEFTGFVNPEPYYRRAELLLLTSTSEGFGMVVLEGMSYGAVPMAFDSYPAVHDLIMNKSQLVKPFSVSEYARKLTHLMTDWHERKRLRMSGYAIAEKFGTKEIADEWETLMTDVLSGIKDKSSYIN